MSCCIWPRQMAVVILGLLCWTAGVYLFFNWTETFTQMRGKEMALSPTSKSYPDWKVSPLPLYLDVYLFNWTNPEDFHVGSNIKPHFQQLGPYRFREHPDKLDIEWHNHNSTISFRKKGVFYFDAQNSRGRLDDRVTSVNTVAHSAALRAKNAGFLERFMVQKALNSYDEGISITKTADQWIFTGYLDPLVTMGNFFSKFSTDIVVPYDRVGFMYPRNNSATFDGHFNMYTGAHDIYKIGQVHTWNYNTHTGAYDGECGEVKGSMGEFFPPNISPNDTLYLFMPNFCRSVPLEYTETLKIHGVTAYKFSGGERSLDNGTLYPENKCFCVNGKCEPSGVLNISPCKYNSSIYMSYPHFYKADPVYLEAVEGLHPIKEKHEFFMTLEPHGGLPMEVGGGFQANYMLEPVYTIAPFQDIPRTLIPLMWCEERVTVSAEIASDIALVPLIVLMGQLVTAVLLATGLLLVSWYPTKYISQIFTDPKGKSKLFTPHLLMRRPRPLAATTSHKEVKSAKENAHIPLIDSKNAIKEGKLPSDALMADTPCCDT